MWSHLSRKEKDMPVKPTEREEEYFARTEFERLKKIEEEKHKKLAQEQKKHLRDLHYMRCPKCGMELVEIDYKGITIDRCSECDGVWLDAGELHSVSKLEKSGLDKFFSIFK
jgi:YgiT-type zinc finger domain-containing protein